MKTEPVNLESAAAELYATDPDGFIARRTELVRAARLAGNRTLAAAIGKLRKPTRSAWLVNLYARSASDDLVGLLELGAALRVAQEQLSTTDLRQLSAQRNAVVAAASRRAVALAETHGYRATEAVRQEVSQTLQAALADPAVAEQVRAGTVTEAHTYGGFGPLTFPTATAPATSAGSERAAESAASDTELARAEQARADAEQRLQAVETALEQAADRAEEAAEQVAELAGQAAELAEQIATLQSRLRDVEQASAQAEQRAADAQTTMAELQDRVRVAREAYGAL